MPELISGPSDGGGPGTNVPSVTKRKVAAIAVVTLLAGGVIGGLIGFAWHAPGRPSTWADVRDWLTTAAIVLGFPALLYQLNLQRLQYADEAKRNVGRDDLLDRQRRELQQRAATEERKQADAVEFSWQQATPLAETPEQGPIEYVWMGVVRNGSRRPIRDAVCRIQPHPAQDFDWGAQGVGELVNVGMGSNANALVFKAPKLGDRVPLIRAGESFGFKTSIPAADHGAARMKIRFTDDAGMHWDVDPDLHLEKLDARDW
jgi:hypothetical protein